MTEQDSVNIFMVILYFSNYYIIKPMYVREGFFFYSALYV